MSMAITTAHRAARSAATVAQADAGLGNSSIRFLTTQGGTLLAVRALAKPCGTIIADGRISLQPANTNDLVVVTGEPTWAEWCDGNGLPIAGGAVTNEAGPGPFKLAGTESMIIYQGGLLLLALPALLG